MNPVGNDAMRSTASGARRRRQRREEAGGGTAIKAPGNDAGKPAGAAP
jgi:hypothetical protein